MSKEYRQRIDAKNNMKIEQYLSDMPMLVDKYVTSTARTKASRTMLSYIQKIRHFLEYMRANHPAFDGKTLSDITRVELDQITIDDAEDFLAFLFSHQLDCIDKTNSNNTVENYISALNSFFRFLSKREEITKNPFEDVQRYHKKVTKPLFLDKKESLDFYDHVMTGEGLSKKEQMYRDKHDISFRDYLICKIMGTTGIRVSECVGLNLDDIDFKNKSLSIIRKGKKKAHVYISDTLARELTEYIEDVRPLFHPLDSEQALFLVSVGKYKGCRLTVRSVQRLIKKYAIAAGVSNASEFSPHTLRHSFAMNAMKESGGNIRLTQQLLGHESITTTTVYVQALDDELREMRNKMDPNE
ncbi:Site-specific recombinase XerD [Lachnospiraceae bacterium KHCPX20]|nr:Site-specific recombinase XerD [Lachnospiraceae bacterium KHCPX20]